jgi:hypothetical protein
MPIQTGHEVFPVSCTMGTGSFPVVKRLGSGVELPSPSSAEMANRLELYLQLSSVPGVTFIFNL